VVTFLRSLVYPACLALLWPFNQLLSRMLAGRFEPGSVLHVSYMGHIPYQAVQALRAHGVRADYLAIGHSPVWTLSDYQIANTGWPLLTPFREFLTVWRVVARYEILHLHFMVTPTRTGWELPLLKRIGRKIVVHYRGCEVRDRHKNMAMHPAINICQECDYDPWPCQAPYNVARRRLAAAHADAELVTTPDLKEFAPAAEHIPFFAPVAIAPAVLPDGAHQFRIVHATNHPGIEGTRHIRAAIDRLRQRGFMIRFDVFQNARHHDVLAALASADLAIGKMKMGYYANAQIESMAAAVPTITYVRPELMTPDLERSGFIFATLETLESVLEHYLTHPAELAAKRSAARESILALHDNARVSQRYVEVYQRMTTRA